MNKLRFIALALCAVMAFGLICGCKDTKPVGTVSDGASQVDNTSSEDPIFTKTGKLTDEEIKIIAADRIGKYNDFLDFITNECFDKYTDKTKKLPISSPEYYKIIDDGKYNISTYDSFENYVYTFLSSHYEEDKLLSFDTVLYTKTDEQKAYAYSGTDKGKVLTAFDEKTDTSSSSRDMYIRKHEPRTEKYAAKECIPVDSEDDFFIVDAPVYNVPDGKLLRYDTFFFYRSDNRIYFTFKNNLDEYKTLSTLSDDEAQKVANSLATAYCNIYKYFYSSGLCSRDSKSTMPYSDGTYQKMGTDEKTGLNSLNIMSYLSETYFDINNGLGFSFYHETLPLEFIIDGKKHYTASKDVVEHTFAAYNGEVYAINSGTSVESFPRAEDIKIKYTGKNLIWIEMQVYDTKGNCEGGTYCWLIYNNGKFKVLFS